MVRSPSWWDQAVGARFGRAPMASRLLRLAVSSVLVMVGAVACTEPPTPPPVGPKVPLCELMPTRSPCRELAVGDRTQRYEVLLSATPTTRSILVDFGGPGAAALGDNGLATFRTAYPEFDAYNLVVLEEPWVVQPVPDTCSTALTGFYHSLRASTGVRDAGRTIGTACEIGTGRWGFTPTSYRAAVSAVLAHEGLDLTGFVGHSWGGVRLSYLDSVSLSFAILVRPFPVRANLHQLLSARARLVSVSGYGLETETAVPARSLPVTQFDYVSANVALGYLNDSQQGEYRERLDAHDPTAIGELSDRLWGRYGVDSISMAVLAEWDEVCPLIGGPAGEVAPTTTLGGVLAARFAPCQAPFPRAAATLPALGRACVVTSDGDSVTPAALIKPSYAQTRTKIQWIRTRTRSHSSFDGLSDCSRAVLAAP